MQYSQALQKKHASMVTIIDLSSHFTRRTNEFMHQLHYLITSHTSLAIRSHKKVHIFSSSTLNYELQNVQIPERNRQACDPIWLLEASPFSLLKEMSKPWINRMMDDNKLLLV